MWTDIRRRLGLDGPAELSLALRDTQAAALGNVAEGWQEPGPHEIGRQCHAKHLFLRRDLWDWPDEVRQLDLAFSIGGWIEDAWGFQERRFLARSGPSASPVRSVQVQTALMTPAIANAAELRMPVPVITVEQDSTVEAIAHLVLDRLGAPTSKLAYGRALRDFLSWYARQPAARFDKATVQRYRAELMDGGLAPSSINERLRAIRALAQEVADNGLIDAQLAAGVAKVSTAGYYAWRQRPPSARAVANAQTDHHDPSDPRGQSRDIRCPQDPRGVGR